MTTAPSRCTPMSAMSAMSATLALALVGVVGAACDEAALAQEAEILDPEERYLELGQGIEVHEAIEDGDTLQIYLGAQNLVMFALTVRVEGIEVPKNPLNYTDELAPEVDVGIEIPGFGDDNGYFSYVDSFPLALHTQDDEAGQRSYVAVYVPVIFPDSFEAEDVFGSEATVSLRLRPASGPSLNVSHTMIVSDEMLHEGP